MIERERHNVAGHESGDQNNRIHAFPRVLILCEKQQGFELVSLHLFATVITFTPRAPGVCDVYQLSIGNWYS